MQVARAAQQPVIRLQVAVASEAEELPSMGWDVSCNCIWVLRGPDPIRVVLDR